MIKKNNIVTLFSRDYNEVYGGSHGRGCAANVGILLGGVAVTSVAILTCFKPCFVSDAHYGSAYSYMRIGNVSYPFHATHETYVPSRLVSTAFLLGGLMMTAIGMRAFVRVQLLNNV